MKTARFTDVVAAGGRPEIHLTWTDPASDRVLQAAAKQSRVLTIHRHTRGGKQDYGVVGIEPGPDAQLLIFPKSLRRFFGKHVVAIRYDLLAENETKATAAAAGPKARTSKAALPRHPSATTKPPKKIAAKVQLPATAPREKPKAKEPPPWPPETDPVKAGIRRALDQLADGHVPAATQTLRALVPDHKGSI